MLTELQQQKLGHMFDAYDADKNGFLEESDFASVGQRLAAALNQPQSDISNWFLGFWQGLKTVAGPDGRVTKADWLGFLDQMWSDEKVYEATIEAGIAFYFKALDANGDGTLSPVEYGKFFGAFSLDPAMDEVFSYLDINGDGVISLEEYNQLVRQFYGTDPNAPGNWLMGRYEGITPVRN
jgi:Ca2+-binding EF-hand superfamily protein